ncbi:MAG: acylphosphatase [Parvularcula sp.]|uniref:acylphosphatase n=1 Tax=Hyphococcus sp. TaxID=2038636 RepID=UPI000C3B577A|nr:acylphosphatase [Parvularcula sp.]
MADKTVKARITGRVQGVSYRAWTREAARAQGLSGWVRNCADGSVEAVFAGDRAAVDAMIAACRKGPPAARVDNVETADAAALQGDDFEIRY